MLSSLKVYICLNTIWLPINSLKQFDNAIAICYRLLQGVNNTNAEMLVPLNYVLDYNSFVKTQPSCWPCSQQRLSTTYGNGRLLSNGSLYHLCLRSCYKCTWKTTGWWICPWVRSNSIDWFRVYSVCYDHCLVSQFIAIVWI